MDELQKQVGRARRRLDAQSFAGALIWCWLAALLVALLAVAAPKLWPIDVDPALWAGAWTCGALLAGLVAAGAWTFFARRSPADAALEIDRRFELRERVSSAVTLDEAQRTTPAGQALLADAARRVNRLDVPSRFGISLGRKAWLSLLPAAALAALVLFVPDRLPDAAANDVAGEQAVAVQVRAAAQPLQKKLEEKRAEAQQKGLKSAENLFKKIEQGAKELAERDDVDRKEALVKLNDLAKQVADRRDRLGGKQRLEEQLNQLKNNAGGPADKLVRALKDGDFAKAKQQVEELKKQLAKGDLSEEQKAQAAKQLADVQKQIEQLAESQKQAQEKLRNQIEQMKQAGQTAQAGKLQEQLDQLERQGAQMDKLSDLASKLGQAAEAAKQGQGKEASQALDQLASELDKLQKENDEVEMLDGALDQIAQAKAAANCEACNGEGCEACQGGGKPGDQLAAGGQGDGLGPPGDGLGQGRGKGARPEEKTATKTRDTSTRQKVGGGGAVVTGEIAGPNLKGVAQERIAEAIEAGRRRAEDPSNRQQLPREQREHVQEYFDALREGK